MFTFRTTAAFALSTAILAGCTETTSAPSRAQITADPILNKYDSDGGGGGCVGGGQPQSTGSGTECLPYDYPNGQPRIPRTPGQPQSGGNGNPGGGQQAGTGR